MTASNAVDPRGQPTAEPVDGRPPRTVADSSSALPADRRLLWLAGAVSGVVLAAFGALVLLDGMLSAEAPAYADPSSDLWSTILLGAVMLALAMVVVIKERRHAIGWLLLALTVLETGENLAAQVALVGLHARGHIFDAAAGWAALAESLQRAQFGIVFAIALLFPTGRVTSPRWRPVVVAVVVVFGGWFLDHLLRPGPLEESPFTGVQNPLGVSWLGGSVLHYAFLPAGAAVGIVVVASLVVRFRRSSGDERQQLKWVGLLIAGVPIGVLGLGVASLVGGDAMNVAGNVVWAFLDVGLPVAVVAAITRYHLYDLDLWLNRTVVYTALSAVLAATYATVVLLAIRLVTQAGWSSPGVVASATLAAAVVASPARRYIQDGVDRVFHRRAWNAQRRIDAFAERWRENPQPPSALRDVFAEALGDPTVELGFWLRGYRGYIGLDGCPLPLPAASSGRSALHIDVHGAPVAVVVHDAALDRDRRLTAELARAASLVTENARLQAEVLAQLGEVEASRSRIIHAADAERRRVERDLHDGAQQRLVGLALHVKLAGRSAEAGVQQLLAGIVDELQAATRELRELARGIHPAALDEGLDAALQPLVARIPLPVFVNVPRTRLPAPIELTAYYLACEAITNAAKHARATRVDVTAVLNHGTLRMTVRDDGCGGAMESRGSGLAGLRDRVAAVGGTFVVSSTHGVGTCIEATIPCAS